MSWLNYSNLIDPLLKKMRLYSADFLESKDHHTVIDVCCGTGDQVFYYQQKGLKATGIDKRKDMIKTAQKRKRGEKTEDVAFQIADATDLPFKDNAFGAGSISLALHEMKERERLKTVSELKRVVKKGGSLLLADFQVPLPGSPFAYGLEFIEYLAGEENYMCYRDYLDHGGLPHLLSQKNLKEEKKGIFLSNLINLIITNNP